MMLEYFKTAILPLKNKLFRYAYSILGDDDTAKDVVQETLLKAWEKRTDFHQIKSPEAWCMTLTKNFALDKFRSKHHKTVGLVYDFDKETKEQTPYEIAENTNTMETIDEIVNSLPAKQREVFQLRNIEEYSYAEICEITGYNINDVKVNIFRARKAIRTVLLKLDTHGLEKSSRAS
jgi:RNA polymerase sigma factor (sigma-70 family)